MKAAKFGVVLLVCALCVFAGEPWDDKEPRSWTAKDVERILALTKNNQSPWAKRVPTRIEEVKAQDKRAEVRSTQTFERGEKREDDFVVAWWWSSKTVRRAFLRLYELKGQQVSPEQAREFAESDIGVPTVSIMGGGMMVAIAGKLPEDELKSSVWLESKRVKGNIHPAEIQVVTDAGGTPERILFVFPEKVGDQPVAAADDKRVLFRWKLPKRRDQKTADAEQFEASFDLSKMLAQKSPDF